MAVVIAFVFVMSFLFFAVFLTKFKTNFALVAAYTLVGFVEFAGFVASVTHWAFWALGAFRTFWAIAILVVFVVVFAIAIIAAVAAFFPIFAIAAVAFWLSAFWCAVCDFHFRLVEFARFMATFAETFAMLVVFAALEFEINHVIYLNHYSIKAHGVFNGVMSFLILRATTVAMSSQFSICGMLILVRVFLFCAAKGPRCAKSVSDYCVPCTPKGFLQRHTNCAAFRKRFVAAFKLGLVVHMQNKCDVACAFALFLENINKIEHAAAINVQFGMNNLAF